MFTERHLGSKKRLHGTLGHRHPLIFKLCGNHDTEGPYTFLRPFGASPKRSWDTDASAGLRLRCLLVLNYLSNSSSLVRSISGSTEES